MSTDLVLSIPADARDAWRRIADRIRDLDPECAAAAALIDARFGAGRDEARRRRDAAIVALAADFPDQSKRAQAEAVAKALDRYAAGDWKREDRDFGAVKAAHQSTRRARLFAVMKACEGKPHPEVDRIRQIISLCSAGETLDNFEAVAISHGAPQPVHRRNLRDRLTMNTPLRHDDRKFIDQVRRHPVGQGVVTDENRRLTAERQKLIDRINAIEDAAPRENATHDKRVAAATAKVLAAEAEWRAAQGALREALAAQSAEMWSRTAERAQLETALRGTADNDLVDRLRRQVGEEMEALRKVAPETEEITGRGSRLLPGSQAEARKFASKIRSIRVRLKALRGLLDECEALRFTSDQTSIQGRFDAKHADLPPLAVETIGEDELLHGWRA